VRDRWDRPISENTLRKYFKPEIAREAAKVNALMGLFIVKSSGPRRRDQRNARLFKVG
jgi:hypothetical protein